MTLATDLDGTYTVTSLTSYQGPLQKQSDGITKIEGGKTFRVDEAGCEWRSTFEWVNDTQVKLTSVADPKKRAQRLFAGGAGRKPHRRGTNLRNDHDRQAHGRKGAADRDHHLRQRDRVFDDAKSPMTLAEDLDGKYTVLTQGARTDSQQKKGDGFTVIKDGKTMRLDAAGCEWRSTFTWVDENTVKMTSVVDPALADDGFQLKDAEGNPTSEPQTYETVLNVKREGEALQLSGTISSDGQNALLIMRKVQA